MNMLRTGTILFERYKNTMAVVGVIVGLILLFNIGGYFYNKHYHENIHKHPKGYCYQVVGDTVLPAKFVQKERHIGLLVQYYKNMEKGIADTAYKYSHLSLPLDTCVYILDYDKDSIVAEVACYYTWGKRNGYVTGFVYAATLHKTPPADSLIIAKDDKQLHK